MKTDCFASYSSVKELPYCSQYAGNMTLRSLVQHQCTFYDGKELPVNLPSGVLIPTYVKEYKQSLGCDVTGGASGECVKKYRFLDASGAVQNHGGEAVAVSEHYVADVDDFTVLIDHTVLAGEKSVDDFGMTGYYEDCHNVKHAWHRGIHKSDCERIKVRATGSANQEVQGLLQRGQAAEQRQPDEAHMDAWKASLPKGVVFNDHMPEPKVFAIKFGDVISVQSMLAMAGRRLTEEWLSEGNDFQSMRESGGVLSINIEYNNWTPWSWKGMEYPEYTISARSRLVRKFKDYKVKPRPDGTRDVHGFYGVLVMVTQTGELGSFNFVTLLVMLTTSLGLLAVSAALTDFLATSVMPRKAEYTKLKFQESADMNPDPFHEAEEEEIQELPKKEPSTRRKGCCKRLQRSE
jgi:hypothetical protein